MKIRRWSRAERDSTTQSITTTATLNLTGQAELLRLRKRERTIAHGARNFIGYLAFYNGKPYHSKLGYQSPLQYERDFYMNAPEENVRF